MKLVAVIDLMGGHVVHARRGMRRQYQPLCSSLCASSDPLEVAAALCALHPFRVLYVADLDAILGRGDNRRTLEKLRHSLPALELWVDAGFASLAAYRGFCAVGLGVPVLGSESQSDSDLLRTLGATGENFVLSLDFKSGEFLGPADALASPALWPRRVVAMNLDRVGSGSGPDTDLLRTMQSQAPSSEVYAAGGVRGRADLERLRDAGAAGVLLASALHDGALGAADLMICSQSA